MTEQEWDETFFLTGKVNGAMAAERAMRGAASPEVLADALASVLAAAEPRQVGGIALGFMVALLAHLQSYHSPDGPAIREELH